jgi:hypothetical protein
MLRRLRRAVAVLTLVAAGMASASCSSSSGTSASLLAGSWSGTTTLSYAGGGGASGGSSLQLSQGEDFASGILTWSAYPDSLPVGGAVTGDAFSFLISYTCDSGNGGVQLEGTVAGDVMTLTGASGIACSPGGPDIVVTGASGTLNRFPPGFPL